MKRWMAIGASAVAVASLLAGCSSNGGGDGEGGEVTLTYGVWSQDETMQALIDAFEKENPDIKVELQVNPWTDFWTKLQVGAQGGR